ncbi:MAG: RlmE family RNA methyltransferase [Treponema sp.]|nr:RlmE family RNA methyltransferase [Treponema sp.]
MADYKKPDHWQQKARKEGYPARSVYKLIEINEKFNIFKAPNNRVLDIGAAPGSWSLWVLRKMASKGSGFLTAVDLSPLSDELFSGNLNFIQGDITAEDVRQAVLSGGPYGVIISDAAPKTTGNHMVDSARSVELVEAVLSYVKDALAAGGNLAVKVFQGSGSDAVLKHMKTLFTAAKSFKPQACRGESVETYFIGIGKR